MKTKAEKLRDCLERAKLLAEDICEEELYSCDENCPMYVENKDKVCARFNIQDANNVVNAYARRKAVVKNLVHK